MQVSNFEYIERIHFYREPQGKGKLLILEQPYTVIFRLDGRPLRYTVPAEFQTDGPSVPKWVPKWVAQTGLSIALEAAVVHDHMCVIKGPWSSKVAAAIFREGLKATSGSEFWQWYMYRAVTLAGPKWEGDDVIKEPLWD